MRNVIVTGGGGGIGRAISQAFAGAGDRVGILDLDPLASRAAGDIAGAIALPCDVTDERAVAGALEAFGAVPDVLVNSAGIVRRGLVLDHTIADFRRVIEINLVGAFIVSQAVARRMAQRGSGNIVNISSIGSLTAATNCGGYGPAKAGLTNLTKLFAVELAPFGIRVNSVAPGLIAAGMGEVALTDPHVGAMRRAVVPSGELGRAEDVADAVLFLASDRARYISGEQIVVDAGLTTSVIARLQPAARPQ